jgi:hypothetical protein
MIRSSLLPAAVAALAVSLSASGAFAATHHAKRHHRANIQATQIKVQCRAPYSAAACSDKNHGSPAFAGNNPMANRGPSVGGNTNAPAYSAVRGNNPMLNAGAGH